jgi:S-DNA-T family DNA segregation ATPase FtsK/SpoIIIE
VAGPYAEPLAVDLATPGLRLLVAGPPRTGRTTALQVVLAQVADPTGVLVVAPARSPLARTAVARGVRVVDPQAAGEAADGLPPDGLLLVDDAERLTDTVLGERLTDLVRRRQDELRVVLTARTDDAAVAYRGLLSEVRRARAGVLLAPAPADGDILGLRLPRTREPPTPGRGVAALAGVTTSGPADEPVTIQLAVPDGAESSG